MSQKLEQLTAQAIKGQLNRRDFMRRASALGIALPFTGALFSQSAMAETPKKGGTLILGLAGGATTDSLDPALALAQVAGVILKAWGNTLVTTSPTDGSVQPELAESWEATPGAKTWTFTLRKGVTFHNGKEMTSDDVVKTLQRHSGEETKSAALGIMRGIESFKTAGKYQFVVELKSGNADLPYLLSDYHLVIQPNGGIDNPTAAIGTGPYKLESNEAGVRFLGSKYANHWDANAGHVDAVEIRVLNDQTARMAALRSGQIHIANLLDPKTAKLMDRLPNVTIQNTSGRAHYLFPMHCDKAPFENNDLRLAMKYAIDRQEMVDRILHGYGSIGNDIPINGAYDLFSNDIEQRSYDPDKAAFHYKKSGHSGQIQLNVSDVAFPGAVDASLLYQQHAKKAGIDIQVNRSPSDGYWSNVWNKKPFCASYTGGRATQDLHYSIFYSSTADWNDTKWKRPKFDDLLTQAQVELDQVKRKALYREMAVMMRDDGGAIIPMFNDYIDGTNEKVKGFIKDPAGQLSNNYAISRCWLA
ncbi:MAG: periplasmic dipeptide transport protein DppA [Osedax symbiont Rs1]|nr:MAG: periplasmic dipeptide transport protein DppA [Osedax symbiont Rs1]